MLTRPLAPAPSTGPGPSLLFSLSTWTWSGPGPDGQDIAHILLAHPPGRTSHDTPSAIETRMRHVGASLGPLVGAHEAIADLNGCLRVISSRVLLKFGGSRYGLRLPIRPGWTDLIIRRGRAVLILGLDPLPQSTTASRLDTYLDTAREADRLLFGLARTP
ncbi:hypothetical protein [Streptomyces hesseae]|uniref:Uncharacterized protein n=1 Tax=Streptomyces hesseae TaxID=3075519 RepID=A0ABU2SWP7_9ACTN|nr:hypothetical protein [Streptomyces sp. DSM 40473]MDT0453416.1 hypothetical protein [Streptomyces sp. DSM 40473]